MKARHDSYRQRDINYLRVERRFFQGCLHELWDVGVMDDVGWCWISRWMLLNLMNRRFCVINVMNLYENSISGICWWIVTMRGASLCCFVWFSRIYIYTLLRHGLCTCPDPQKKGLATPSRISYIISIDFLWGWWPLRALTQRVTKRSLSCLPSHTSKRGFLR